MTLRQQAATAQFNASKFGKGKTTLSFNFSMNDNGGFYVDFITSQPGLPGGVVGTFFGHDSEADFERLFREAGFNRDLKKNAALFQRLKAVALNYFS